MSHSITINNGTTGFAAGRQKSVGVAYLWLFLLGIFGAHQFYLGKSGRGILYLFTLGLFTIGCWIDLFTLASQTRAVNTQRALGIK
jgi:TM2 domain-containing membrane protein YozV